MSDTRSLEGAFTRWAEAFNAGSLDVVWGMMDDGMVIFDEDIPWRFSKADFQNHIDFHTGGLWESFEWVPREMRYQRYGETGVVSGFSTFRGKPRDAGFRQRFMCFTQTWVAGGDGWKMVAWQQGVLQGQIEGSSPS